MNGSSGEDDITCLPLKGRIDSITCREIESLFRDAIMDGKRTIVADMTAVNYVSSAGLRIFLSVQKELRKAGGQVYFSNTSPAVYSIFEISGFTTIFRFLDTSEDIQHLFKAPDESPVRDVLRAGASLKVLTTDCPRAKLSLIGSERKLSSADYTQEDVVPVPASDIDFGTGLAALGNGFDDYKNYFGETIVINGNMFVYPAIPRSAVDFIIHKPPQRDSVYHFLHGFSFPAMFRHMLTFEPEKDHVSLDEMIDIVFGVSDARAIGIVGIFESRGLFGMRLKKIPLKENASKPGMDIFSGEYFSEWIDYSIEAEDVYNLTVITGIAVKDKDSPHGNADDVIP
ncbi:MAG: STAS domain-containing protein, partial [Syntrophorhabdus sp.]